jgi:hypothetical protein
MEMAIVHFPQAHQIQEQKDPFEGKYGELWMEKGGEDNDDGTKRENSTNVPVKLPPTIPIFSSTDRQRRMHLGAAL